MFYVLNAVSTDFGFSSHWLGSTCKTVPFKEIQSLPIIIHSIRVIIKQKMLAEAYQDTFGDLYLDERKNSTSTNPTNKINNPTTRPKTMTIPMRVTMSCFALVLR